MNSKISDKDKKDWNNFLSSDEKLSDKDSFSNQKKKRREIVFDLHGFSLDDISDVIVKASKANGEKCQRCWKYEAKLINDEVCNRCNTVIFK